MKVTEAKNHFLELAERFFDGYNVIFSYQSRIAKPKIPLVVLSAGNVKRPQAANHSIGEDGVLLGHYLSKVPITIDLFTNGRAVMDEDGTVIGYENTAVEEMLEFADYLNSPLCTDWCYTEDVTILIESDAMDLTGVVNDNNYEYRSRQEVLLYFTQEVDEKYGNMGYFDTVDASNES